jgi:hypothetical protein
MRDAAETLDWKPKFKSLLLFGALGLVFVLCIIFAGDSGDKERNHAEEATHPAVRVGTYLPAGYGGVRAKDPCQA